MPNSPVVLVCCIRVALGGLVAPVTVALVVVAEDEVSFPAQMKLVSYPVYPRQILSVGLLSIAHRCYFPLSSRKDEVHL